MDELPFSSFCRMMDRGVSVRRRREEDAVVIAAVADAFAVDAEVDAVVYQMFEATLCG